MATFLRRVGAAIEEILGITTSAGAGDADKIPVTNGSGFLAPSLLNGTNTSAGAADAAKVVLLDAAGLINNNMMPVGIGADTSSIVASEILAAGDFVNVWNDAGTSKVRKADGSGINRPADGFVLAGFAAAATATVYAAGTNNAVTGLTIGPQFLNTTTAGLAQATSPTGAGRTAQSIGFAISATEMVFQRGVPINMVA